MYLKRIEIRSQISENTPISVSLKSQLKLIDRIRLRYYTAKRTQLFIKKINQSKIRSGAQSDRHRSKNRPFHDAIDDTLRPEC